jgi:putative transcriptional regulator
VNKNLFGELIKSMTQKGAIVRGERKPSREFHVDSQMVKKKLRAASGLSQPKFAALLAVDVGTLRNWEQGIRPVDRQRRYSQRSRMTSRTS